MPRPGNLCRPGFGGADLSGDAVELRSDPAVTDKYWLSAVLHE